MIRPKSSTWMYWHACMTSAHVVLDEHHRDAVVRELGEQAGERLGLLGRLAGRRLVEEEHARASRQGTAELDQAGLSGRELSHLGVGQPGQPDPLQDLGRHLLAIDAPVAGVVAVDVSRHADVLADREQREQLQPLERTRQAASGALVRRQAVDLVVVEADESGRTVVAVR